MCPNPIVTASGLTEPDFSIRSEEGVHGAVSTRPSSRTQLRNDIVDLLEPLRATAPDTVAVLRRLVDDFDYDGMTKLLG